MRIPFLMLLLLLGVIGTRGDVLGGNTCMSIPVSLANVTNCVGETCTATTSTTVNIPNLIGASACLEFLSPNGQVSSYALNITVSAVNLDYQFDYCYFTDDPPGESKGLCGCPGGTTALCPCNSVSFSGDFVTVCSAGTHDDSYCILNKFGRTGTWCGKTIFYTHPRYLVCHSLGSMIKSVNLTVNDQEGEWLVHYDGSYNYIALNDSVSNVRIISDSVSSSFVPEFVFFDTWNPEQMYYYTSGECNSLNEYDVQKLGWNKFYYKGHGTPNTTALVSPQFGDWIKWTITDCEDNKFQVKYPQFNIQSMLKNTVSNQAEHVTPGAYVRDGNHRIIAGKKRLNGVNIAAYENYYQNEYFLFGGAGGTGATVRSAIIYNTNFDNRLMDPSTSTFNLTVEGFPTGEVNIQVSCQDMNNFAIEADYPIHYCRETDFLFDSTDPNRMYTGRAFAVFAPGCNSPNANTCPQLIFTDHIDARWEGTVARFTLYPSFSVTPLFQHSPLNDIYRYTYYERTTLLPILPVKKSSSFLNPLDLAVFSGPTTPTFMSGVTLVVPATLGSFFVEVEFKNVTVRFQQSGVKPKIKSVSIDKSNEHIIVVASSMTSAGSCYAYSFPEGLFLTSEIDLITTFQSFVFPTYTVAAKGSYSVGIRCYQYTDQQSISVDFNHSSTTPDHYPAKGTPGWENSWNPGNLWDTLSSLFDGNFGIPALIASLVYGTISIVVLIGALIIGWKLLKCVFRKRRYPTWSSQESYIQKHGLLKKRN